MNIYDDARWWPSACTRLCDLSAFRPFCARGPNAAPHAGRPGSGVVVREDGYVLTNNHVIADADEIYVSLADGRRPPAPVVGADAGADLAVLRVPPATPEVIAPRHRGILRVGDVVLAIGNPFGIGQTVSQGIVSALGRYGFFANPYEDFIQTDAAINPGNSGGALVEQAGELVGLNTMIFSVSGGQSGHRLRDPRVRRPRPCSTDIIAEGRGRPRLARRRGGPVAGADDGPAHREHHAPGTGRAAGLRAGDLIVTLDDMPVGSLRARDGAAHRRVLEPGAQPSPWASARRRRAWSIDGDLVGRRPPRSRDASGA